MVFCWKFSTRGIEPQRHNLQWRREVAVAITEKENRNRRPHDESCARKKREGLPRFMNQCGQLGVQIYLLADVISRVGIGTPTYAPRKLSLTEPPSLSQAA